MGNGVAYGYCQRIKPTVSFYYKNIYILVTLGKYDHDRVSRSECEYAVAAACYYFTSTC